MLYFDRINVSEGTDINKTSVSKECDVCHYWYFLYKGFKFQPHVFHGCHGVLVMSMNLSDIAILSTNGSNYCSIIDGISKREAVNLLKKATLNEKSGTIENIIFLYRV